MAKVTEAFILSIIKTLKVPREEAINIALRFVRLINETKL